MENGFLVKRLDPTIPKPDPADIPELRDIRNRLMNWVLFLFLVFGTPAFLVFVWNQHRLGEYGVTAAYTGFLLAALAIALVRKRISFDTRATAGLSLFYILAVIVLFRMGLGGIGPYFLVAFCVLSTAFKGFYAGAVAFFFSLLAFAAAGVLEALEILSFDHTPYRDAFPEYHWVFAALIFSMLVTAMVGSQGLVLRRMVTALQASRRQEKDLQRANEDLRAEVEERRRAVEELRLSDTRFKAIIESTEDILYRQDLVTGDMDYMSPSVEDILGYTVEEMCAMSLSEGEKLFHPADLPMVHEFRHNLVEMEKRGEPHYEMEFRMRRRDGGFEFFRGTYHVMREEPNRVFVVGSLKPISQYKLAEERLKESESRFRLLAENASDVIWTMDQDLRFTYVSQSIERVYGYPRKESLENRLYEIMPPESLNTLMEKFSQIMSGGDGIPNRTSFEITQYRADGSLIWTDVDLVLVKDAEGNLRYLQGLTRDITARKQVENALRESESKFRSLSEAAFEGIVFHREGRILLANQKFYDLFGYTPKELEGDDALSRTVTPESAVIVQRKIREKTEGPYEVTGLHKSGRTFPLEIQGKSMIGSDSRMRVAAVRDISHRKEAERKLLDYQKQLRSLASELTLAEENERRRVALLLHDGIGQELAFANIQLKMAREDVRDDGPGRILDEVCELIDRTIDEARGLTMELSPPILYEMSIQNALKWLFDQYGKRLRIRGDFEIREPIPTLSVNRKILLFQIYRELLVNLSKYARAESMRGHIRTVDRWLEVELEDDGVGFDPAELTKWERKSTGFGLFSIRERVRHFGGVVSVRAAPGEGAGITIMIPLDKRTEGS